MQNAPDTPVGVESEGAEKRRMGRPPKKPPLNSILRVLKGIEDLALETGKFDPSLSRKLLAAYSAIVLERTLLADERDVPLGKKADVALRIGPIVAMLGELVDRAHKDYPKTEEALDAEITKRENTIGKLLAKGDAPDVQQVLDTLAPAAAVTPEEV